MPLQFPSFPTWGQTKTTAKAGFDKVYDAVDKIGPHVNKLSNKVGAEAFWPTSIDKESDKAARILRSFCKDGFYVDEKTDAVSEGGKPKGKQRVLKKIPESVIKNAKGLAIFTVMRTGLWFSGAGGSGILVGRLPNGDWSPPSGIVLHTAGLGFLAGADIYDCVMVINTEEALQAFTKLRCTIGGEVSATAGPVGLGGVLETEVHKRQAPVWNYLKSRGLYGGVQVDGTIIVERMDENEKFYGQKLPAQDILAGKVQHPPREIQRLITTIKAAQGDRDVDESILPSTSEPLPSDYNFSEGSSTFGLPPDETDPDPFGVKSLQEEGLEIREAGTNNRPSADAFEYKPTPTSPINTVFKDAERRRSMRKSFGEPKRTSIDAGTQTDNVYRPKHQLKAPPPLPPRRSEESEEEEQPPVYKELEEPMNFSKEEEVTDTAMRPQESIQVEDEGEKTKNEETAEEAFVETLEHPEPIKILDEEGKQEEKQREKYQGDHAQDHQGWEQVELGGTPATQRRSMPGSF